MSGDSDPTGGRLGPSGKYYVFMCHYYCLVAASLNGPERIVPGGYQAMTSLPSTAGSVRLERAVSFQSP